MTFQRTRGMLAVLAVLAVLAGCHGAQPDNRPRYATRAGDIVTLHPVPVSFRMPREWLDWEMQFHNNVHLSRPELSTVEHGKWEWNTEYAAVVNSALPFEDCAAQVGQVRAYITDLSLAEVLDRFSGPAMKTARKVAYPPPKKDALAALREPDFTNEGVQERWHKVKVVYWLWYYDYGGLAQIRVYLRPVQSHTLVLVFMGASAEDIREVVDSVTLNSR
jgi:hypothetical protein